MSPLEGTNENFQIEFTGEVSGEPVNVKGQVSLASNEVLLLTGWVPASNEAFVPHAASMFLIKLEANVAIERTMPSPPSDLAANGPPGTLNPTADPDTYPKNKALDKRLLAAVREGPDTGNVEDRMILSIAHQTCDNLDNGVSLMSTSKAARQGTTLSSSRSKAAA